MSPRVFISLGCLVALLCGACSTSPATGAKPPAVAIAVRTIGGTPSPQQFANIHQALQAHVARAGFRFAEHAAAADFVVTASFTPDPVNPNGGHVSIVSVEPARQIAQGVEESSESRELRQRLREIERWIDSQSRPRIGEGGL